MRLEGLLVDLVPYDARFEALEQGWRNGEGMFWGSGGDRMLATKAGMERRRAWQREHADSPWRGVRFGIVTKDDVPLGDMSINWMVSTHRLANLGAVIGEKAYWGGGYGTDALLLLIDYAFDWLDLRRLWLSTTSMNARVMRQMEKVGFTLEAVARQETIADGVPFDGLIYGLLREEWPGREAVIARIGLQARPRETG